MKISFYGAAGVVTGSQFLIETQKTKVLVDCGVHQEGSFCSLENTRPFAFDPKTVAALFITHAHLDHVGRIPKLVHDGFRGKIIATPPTLDLTVLNLQDTLHILTMKEDEDCPQLFSEADLALTKTLFTPTPYEQVIHVGEDMTVTLKDAGHVLGSSMVEIEGDGKKVIISGDIGNAPTPLLSNPTPFSNADVVVMESTYGDRIHEDRSERKQKLEHLIEDTVTRGGALVMPAFALERTQELLFELDELITNHRIPQIPIFIDSPLAIHATEIYKKYGNYFNTDVQSMIRSGNEIFQFPGLRFTLSKEESRAINDVPNPKVIIAGSGNSMGGRILHHERRYLSDPKSLLLIVGYQDKGSRGRRLLEGAKETKIFREVIPVRARVEHLTGYSAHADQEALFQLVANMEQRPKAVYLVHGEPEASQALAVRIRDNLGVKARAAILRETIEV